MRFPKLACVFLGVLFLVGAGARLANAAGNPQEKQQKEEFAAWANNLGGAVKAGQVMITIERWSTPEERNQLLASFKQGGQDALLKTLTKMGRVGFIRLPRTTGWELHYAYQWPQEGGGRVIVIATDRKFPPGEVMYNGFSMDYPFELIQMKVDAQGKGEGKVSFATKIGVSKDGTRLELENYGDGPIFLQNVHLRGEKDKEEPEK